MTERTIIIGVDNSEFSEFAFDFYLKNVHKGGDNIILVHVPEYQHVMSALGPAALLTDPIIVAELIKEEESKVRELVDKYSLKMKESHIGGKVKQMMGKPGEAIVEAAREEDATMIIVGTRGMGKLKRTFVGSVSDYIMHHSDVPVMVCRHKDHIKDHHHNKDHARHSKHTSQHS